MDFVSLSDPRVTAQQGKLLILWIEILLSIILIQLKPYFKGIKLWLNFYTGMYKAGKKKNILKHTLQR